MVSGELLLSPDGEVDLSRRHLGCLFRDPVREHDGHAGMKEVQNSVIDAQGLGPQLLDPVPQVTRFRAMEFVALLPQPLDADDALGLRPPGQGIEPFQKGARAVLIPVEDCGDHRRGHERSLAKLLSKSTVCSLWTHRSGLRQELASAPTRSSVPWAQVGWARRSWGLLRDRDSALDHAAGRLDPEEIDPSRERHSSAVDPIERDFPVSGLGVALVRYHPHHPA